MYFGRQMILATALAFPIASCDRPQVATETKPTIAPTPVAASEENECAAMFAAAKADEGQPAILIFPRVSGAPWGSSEAKVVRAARPITEEKSRDEQGLQIKVDGFSHWVLFKFSGGKLSGIHERHNDEGNAKKYLAALKNKHGSTAPIGKAGWECTATWTVEGTKIVGEWQPSDRYFEVDYEPIEEVAPALPASTQRAIWQYYVSAEDRLGKEAALRETAVKFGVSQDDVFRVGVAGIEGQWDIPEPPGSRAPVQSSPLAPAPKRTSEVARASVPKADQKAYDELRARSYSEGQARAGAAGIRKLCEAAGGRDCAY